MLPAISIDTSSVPEVALVPVQLFEPDAVHEVALVVDQEKVEVLLRSFLTIPLLSLGLLLMQLRVLHLVQIIGQELKQLQVQKMYL